jgi:enoyl-CoA hydratase
VAEISLELTGALGRIELRRPKALNALTLDQVHAMDPQLRAWAEDSRVKAVLITGEGHKAFCAGGDIRALYDAGQRHDAGYFRAFYRDEYRLNRRIKTYPKPYVALHDGIVMGGGVGVSVHGSHRVATENVMFAMPETGIGMFPDVGGTWFLPRLPGEIGTYLALTGARLKAADCLYAGVCTHLVAAGRREDLIAALQGGEVDAVLAEFAVQPGPAPLAEHRATIDRCFAADRVEDILAALAAEGNEWAEQTRNTILAKSPIATKVTLRQMRLGRTLDFDDCMRTEYRLSQRFMAGGDFFEGVRAVIVDKDQSPRWQPASLEAVSDTEVEAFFAPLEDGRELAFE